MSANAKKTRQGSVVSNKMEKSVVILVERMFPHKLYGKFIRKQVRYMAHDAKNECQVGDVVLIEECRPLSRRKRWLVRAIIQRAA